MEIGQLQDECESFGSKLSSDPEILRSAASLSMAIPMSLSLTFSLPLVLCVVCV